MPVGTIISTLLMFLFNKCHKVCHVIEFELGKSTSDRSIIVHFDVNYLHSHQSELPYSVKTETITNKYGDNLGGAPALIWTILLKR